MLYPTENSFLFQGIGQNPKTVPVPKWFYTFTTKKGVMGLKLKIG